MTCNWASFKFLIHAFKWSPMCPNSIPPKPGEENVTHLTGKVQEENLKKNTNND